jgi:hypothetical protein
MNYPWKKIKYNVGKILFLSLFTALQWTNPACAFKPIASGNEKLITHKDESFCNAKDGAVCAPPLPIIPGLVGFGVKTPAGSGPNRSGGTVIHVTNLNDSGAGSLRAALQASLPRIVVFDVSGTIVLQSTILVTNPYLTIAGQTAPYPGISIRGTGFIIETHDVLVQHIRIRVGDDPYGPNPRTRGAITLYDRNNEDDVYNIVIDHVSMSWGVDENMDISNAGTRDITVTNCIISEALWDSIHPKGPHSKGFLIGPGAREILVTGNLLAHNDQRNMRVAGDTSTVFVNNIVYNWHGSRGAPVAGVYSGSEGTTDASIVGNVYIRGLDTRLGAKSVPIYIFSDILDGSRFYIDDNEALEKSSDPWSIVTNESSSSIKVRTPPSWPSSFKAKKGNVVKNWVLSHVGARRSDANPIDLRIIGDVKKGTGRIIDSQDQVGGWLELTENVRGTSGIPVLSIPSNAIQPSGYTKLEEWLHQLARQVEVPN